LLQKKWQTTSGDYFFGCTLYDTTHALNSIHLMFSGRYLSHQRTKIEFVGLANNPVCIAAKSPTSNGAYESLLVRKTRDQIRHKLRQMYHHTGHTTYDTAQKIMYFITYHALLSLTSVYGLRGEGLVWLIRAVACLLAANHESNCSLTQAMDGCILRCGIISSCQSVATSETVKAS